MATATESTTSLAGSPTMTEPDVPPFPVRRFTVQEYDQLQAAGFFEGDDRFELLEGWIVPQRTKNPPHEVALGLADDVLRPLVRNRGWHVRNQGSVRTEESVPEPDLAVVRGAIRDYSERHPGPSDMALAVEVADSSLARDRTIKMRIYARAAISVYWIINLVDRQVEVYTDPSGPHQSPSYRSRQDVREGESLSLVLDGQELGRVAVVDLLP